MRLLQFQVQGYKNFRAPVRLDDIGRFNVIHGDNNVGKSNLLESIGLFFVAIQALREEARGGSGIADRYARGVPVTEPVSDGRPPRVAVRSFDYLAREGYPATEIFDLRDAQPIVLEARLQLDHGASDPPWLGEPIFASVRLVRGDEEVTVEITRLQRTKDGAELASGAGDLAAIDAAFTLVMDGLGHRARGKQRLPRFALIRADRTMLGESPEDAEPRATREPLPRDLGKILHDAENATDVRRARFKTFVAALEHFRDLVGPGQWLMRYNTDADRAELALDTGAERLPLRLMGSGIQQIAALCARLVMTGADILALEEPELNLRWSTQRALRAVLREIVNSPEPPSQLFLTSHSAQFEEEPTFYVVNRTVFGPQIHKKPAEEVLLYTQAPGPAPATGTLAPLGYLTSEGVVQVPLEVRERLKLSHGGGVVFVRGKDGHYRMLTNDQYADLFEEREPLP
jgi:hypothetical protein